MRTPALTAPVSRKFRITGIRHVHGLLEAGMVFIALIAPVTLISYLVGAFHPHAARVDGRSFPDGGFLFDLHVMWQAGHDVITGRSPYPFVYPAPAAVLMAPFGALPWKVAVVAFALVLVGAMVLALRLLGVRDWRCYAAALASMPMASSITIGTLSPLLALATAVAWRYRDRRWVVAAAVAGTVVTKIFLWPLVVWLVATRRFRSALAAAALGVAALVTSWAAIGFAGLREYPHVIAHVAGLEQDKSYSVFALVRSLGISTAWTRAIVLTMGFAALVAVVALARKADGDRRAFVGAIIAALVISPIVWLHYFVLLFVPIAVYRRSLSAAWLLPLLYWVAFANESGGSTTVILRAFGIAIIALGLAFSGWRAPPRSVAHAA